MKIKLEASDRVMLRAYYSNTGSLTISEIKYCDELIKSIINEKMLESQKEN